MEIPFAGPGSVAYHLANEMDIYMWPVLVRTVWEKHSLDRVVQLLNDGAQVNAVDKMGCTGLLRASWRGKIETVRTLLAYGADSRVESKDGSTALLKAIAHKKGAVALLLLEDGKPVPSMEEALKVAVSTVTGDQSTIVTRLLSIDGRKGILQRTPAVLHTALKAKAPINILKLLAARGADVNAPIDGHITPLKSAIAAGNVDGVNWLISSGVSVNAADATLSPAWYAILRQQEGCLRFLIIAGANVRSAAADGVTPLLLAAQMGSITMVKMLEDAGATFTECPAAALQATLGRAAQHTNVTVCQKLLAAGAKATSSVLKHACGSQTPAIVSLLLKHGADPNEKDAAGRTALDYLLAREQHLPSSVETFELLRDAGVDVGSGRCFVERVTFALRALNPALVGTLLEMEPRPRYAPRALIADYINSLVTMSRGTYMFDPRMLKVLLEAGEDVDAPIFIGGVRKSALLLACSDAMIEASRALLAAGARADALPAAIVYNLVYDASSALTALECGAKVPLGDRNILQSAMVGRESAQLVRELIADGASVAALKLTGSWLDGYFPGGEIMPRDCLTVLLVGGYKLNGTESAAHAGIIRDLWNRWATDNSGYTQELHACAWLRRRAGVRHWNAAWTSDE